MKTRLLPAVLALTAFVGGCEVPSRTGGAPSVVVSVFPLADLTSRLAPDGVGVETLLPPRASPSTWEVAPAQIRALHGARGVISVGAGLDAWVEALLPSEDEVPHLRVTDGMELREAGHDHAAGETHPDAAAPGGEGDPHVWLDPLLVRDGILPRLEAFLLHLFPGDSAGIAARGAALADSLEALDREIRALLDDAPRRRFVATHDAWGYFSEAYGLTSLGSVYERPGHEPSARGLARLVRAAREADVPTVLAEPQLASTAAEALAAELGVAVTVVDPLGGPGLEGRESYFAMMRFNALAFREALGAP